MEQNIKPLVSLINQDNIEKIINRVIQFAKLFVGSVETSQNRGKVIDEIEKFYGHIGLPYCTIFVQYIYDFTLTNNYKLPRLFSGNPSSQALFEWCSNLGCTYKIKEMIKPGDIVIWRRMQLWKGHAGLITGVDLSKNVIYTIEGNTSGKSGTDWEGDGIWDKVRPIRPIDFVPDAFWIRGFINIRKLLFKKYGGKV